MVLRMWAKRMIMAPRGGCCRLFRAWFALRRTKDRKTPGLFSNQVGTVREFSRSCTIASALALLYELTGVMTSRYAAGKGKRIVSFAMAATL